MTSFGFHASHEQVAPRELLLAVRRAADAGFGAAMCSDHFAPWSERQGESGFAWSWLGAALEATGLRHGVVSAPGQRYHPAVLAQAAGTLAGMYPGRFWVALGSGEALNEHVTGEPWPPKRERDTRLAECFAVMRALLAGEEVDHRGHVRVDRARLWSAPERPPPLFGAAVTPATAAWLGEVADGLITVYQPGDALQRVIEAFRAAGGDGKPLLLQVHLSYTPDPAEALALAHDQWRTAIFGSPVGWELALPAELDELGRYVRPEDVREHVLVSADLGQHAEWLQRLAELGFDEIYLHHVGREQREFIEAFGESVLPELAA